MPFDLVSVVEDSVDDFALAIRGATSFACLSRMGSLGLTEKKICDRVNRYTEITTTSKAADIAIR